MFLNHWPLSFVQTAICVLVLYGCRYVYWQCTVGAGRRQLAIRNGCKPINWWKAYDPFIGLDNLWLTYKAFKAHRSLELTQRRFEWLGFNTGGLIFLGKK